MPLAPKKETDCVLTVPLKFPSVIPHETKSPVKARDSQIARSLAMKKKIHNKIIQYKYNMISNVTSYLQIQDTDYRLAHLELHLLT